MSKEIAVEVIAARILVLRGKRVILDRDLAKLYGVPAKVLNQAVSRTFASLRSLFLFPMPRIF